jgi:ribosomal protein S21
MKVERRDGETVEQLLRRFNKGVVAERITKTYREKMHFVSKALACGIMFPEHVRWSPGVFCVSGKLCYNIDLHRGESASSASSPDVREKYHKDSLICLTN